jgi:hypothetical protein
MSKTALAACFALLALGGSALADLVPVPNGSFENDGQQNPPFTQNISDWTVSFQSSSTPSNVGEVSGIFTTLGNYVATQGSTFVSINNLGAGEVNLFNTNPFFLAQRTVQFDFAYITNDPIGTSTLDDFRVVIDIFDTVTQNNLLGSVTYVVQVGSNYNTTISSSPYNTNGGQVFSSDPATNYTTVFIPIPQFFQNYARITFIVDNAGPAAGNNNGAGVSGVLLDNILLSPEPSSMALFGLGILGLGGLIRRRRRAAVVTACHPSRPEAPRGRAVQRTGRPRRFPGGTIRVGGT